MAPKSIDNGGRAVKDLEARFRSQAEAWGSKCRAVCSGAFLALSSGLQTDSTVE